MELFSPVTPTLVLQKPLSQPDHQWALFPFYNLASYEDIPEISFWAWRSQMVILGKTFSALDVAAQFYNRNQDYW